MTGPASDLAAAGVGPAQDSGAVGGGALTRLFAHVPRRRRLQLAGLTLLMVIGAAAELVSLGAVVPFLSLLTDPGRAFDMPVLSGIVRWMGWRESSEMLLPATIAFALLVVVSAALRLILLWATNRFVFGLGYDLGIAVYERTLHQPYRYHVARNTSEILAGINKVHQVVTGVLSPLLQGGVALVLGAAILAMLFVIDAPVATAAAASFGTAYLLISWLSRRRLLENSETIARAFSGRIQSVQEGLGGIRDILLDGSQALHVDRFRRIDLAFREAQVANNVIGGAPRYVVEALGVSIIAALAYATALRPGGMLAALPVLGALAFGAQKLIPLAQQVYLSWSLFAGNRAVTIDVVDLLDQPMPPGPVRRADDVKLPFEHELLLRDVGFRYSPAGPWVLQNVDLRIPRGARVGFVGRTGSGKSTLLDLVMGLLEPTTGSILVDGTPLDEANLAQWQARIAHVPQSVFLADASIAANIAFGVDAQGIDLDRVRDAARRAQIADFIESSPDGYEAVVGERGVRLSGGQRQRIGIARALYRNADVLVLDEATSALDESTESAVMESLDGLGREITVLTIAHRLSTLQGCDLIVLVDDGQVSPQHDRGFATEHAITVSESI